MMLKSILFAGMIISGHLGFGQVVYPVTPYTRPPDKQALGRHRETSDNTRWLREFVPAQGMRAITAYSLRFAYVKAGSAPYDLMTTLDGFQDDRPMSIRLGDIDQITVLDRNGGKAILSVVVVPGLDEQALLDLHPTYTQLITKYKQALRIEVSLSDSRGGQYSVVGQNSSDAEVNGTGSQVSFAEMALNRPMKLRYLSPEIWWATLSVFNDPSYPYTDTQSTSTYSDHPLPR
jgi:hypothetical protein